MLGRWMKEHQEKYGRAFRGNDKLIPEQEEVLALRAQIKRLQMAGSEDGIQLNLFEF
jgi:transposase-like protein